MREPRDLPARIVLMNDVALRCLHQFRLGVRHRLQCRGAVAALDRLFDQADGATHLGAARFVDRSAPSNLARRLLGGSGIGHSLKYPSGGARSLLVRPKRAGRSILRSTLVVLERVPEDAIAGPRAQSAAPQRTAAAGLRPPPLAPL